MFNDRGFHQSHRLNGYLCKIHGIRPVGRAILAHIDEQAYYDSALYVSCARRIAEEISASRQAVLNAQRKLKEAGLIFYPSNFGSKLMPIFLPYKIIGVENGAFVITRNWQDAVNLAHQAKIISEPNGEILINVIAAKGRAWPGSPELKKCLARHIAADDMNLDSIVGGNIRPVYSRNIKPDEMIEQGRNRIKEIKKNL